MTNGRLDCVVFDLDGTLLDTRNGMLTAINATLTALDRRAVSINELRASIHEGLGSMLAEALAITGAVPEDDVYRSLYQRVNSEYVSAAREHVSPYPDLHDLLDELQARDVWLAVCTNQVEANARALLTTFALDDYFSEVVGRDTFAFHKPSSLPLAWLMGRCGARPERTLMVGDSELDALCAGGAGVGIILMEHGYGLASSTRGHATSPSFASLRGRLCA